MRAPSICDFCVANDFYAVVACERYPTSGDCWLLRMYRSYELVSSMEIEIYFSYELSGSEFLNLSRHIEEIFSPDYRKNRYEADYHNINISLFPEETLSYFNSTDLQIGNNKIIRDVHFDTKKIAFSSDLSLWECGSAEISEEFCKLFNGVFASGGMDISAVSVMDSIDGEIKFGSLVPEEFDKSLTFSTSSNFSSIIPSGALSPSISECLVINNYHVAKYIRDETSFTNCILKITARCREDYVGSSLVVAGDFDLKNFKLILECISRNFFEISKMIMADR